ncbi:Dcp1p-Dcp2p decapping enzyme complex alpha subunit [Mortierella sp. AD094]|nr:Dcp1p-Dcp2p decapping enzyme complex alpha subunit [Mortierella sp. AD094]
MSLTPRSSTPQMPFEFGVPIDANFRKTLQSRIRTLLQSKSEGYVPRRDDADLTGFFYSIIVSLRSDEEYFVTEKVAGVRYMLLSTLTPKGPACFLIDRHYEISFVPQLLLPLRDNPTKYQNDTLLDGEMVVENDGNKKSLRFLMMDQDILAVQASKTSEVKSKEPFTIERKPMQRSYGLNVILSGSKRHKHGGEGLIFVPVKQPYVPGTSPKLLKWKSHTTAQFQIKVTQSRERKPLYCIHVKHGSVSKFYDYVTPEAPLASEWHSSSPDGKNAEFWWDPQWPTQMFEKGYGLETRTGGWRFYRIREDKKDIDDEATLQAIVKRLDTLVTRQQLESQIDHIRTQWKAREAGTSSNGNIAQKDRERKSSVDEHGSTGSLPAAASGIFSHPLPPKPPPFQPRQSSVDQSQTQSTGANSHSAKSEQEPTTNSTSTASPSTSASQTSDRKTTPPPPTATPTSASPVSGTVVKNPLKLSQVPAHLQPIKSWMTVSPVPRAPPGDRGIKAIRTERRDSRDYIASGGENSPRSNASTTPISRKSSLSITEVTKDSATATPSIAIKTRDSTNSREGPSNSTSNPTSVSHEDQPQTPTPAHTPTPVGIPRPSVTPALPPTLSLPPTSIALPNSIPRNVEKKPSDEHRNTESSVPNDGVELTPVETSTTSLTPTKPLIENGDSSNTPTPILGKRTYGPSTSIGEQSEDSLAQRRKLSDGTLSSPRTEDVMTGIGTLNLVASQSPKPIHSSPLAAQDNKKLSPLLSPLSSPGTMAISSDDRQSSPRSSHPSVPKFTASSKLLHEVSVYPDPTLNENGISEIKEERQALEVVPGLVQSPNDAVKHKHHVAAASVIEDVEMREADIGSTVTSCPLPTPALTLAEKMAYEPPSDQEKRQAIEKASAQAMHRIERQGELQAAKECKMREDVERFKEKSRIRKEKAQKRKLQEVNEAPIQDRRAQPVRQINQQQGKQSNSDTALSRGQSQGSQRQVSSPQDQQRLVYQTRQSKAAFRTEAQQQSAQNSPRVQPRGVQYPGNTKEQVQSSLDSLSQPSAQRDQQAMVNDSDSVSPQERTEQRAHGLSGQKMLELGDATRHHRRINSMDRQIHISQSHNPPTPEQRDIEQYSQPYVKRLDVGQHSDPNHRRSHSDIGVMYKPVVTAIAQPQSITPGPLPVSGEPHVRPELEHRQGPYSSQNPSAPAPFRSDIDSPRMRNNIPFLTATKEPVPTKLESKAKLQFILNDEDSGPDIDEDDARERRPSPERGNWGHDQESVQRAHAQSEYSTRSDYSLQEHQDVFSHSSTPASVVEPESALALARRQQSKKQKITQEFSTMEQNFNHRPDEHEYHMRQSQMQLMTSRPVAQQAQRPMPPADHWPQQAHSQHSHPPQSMPGQPHTPSSHAQAHNLVRRIPAEAQGPPTQQPMSHPSARPIYQNSEHLQHGNAPGRPSHIDQYAMLGPGPVQDGPRPASDRPTHSRHSSLSKPGIAPEHGHPQGLSYQNTRSKATQAHSHADQFGRGYPPVQARSSAQAQLQQAQGQYHPQHQQQQQQAPVGATTRKNIPGEHHAGTFGPPPTSSAHPGYDSRPTHPQHLHPHQQQAIQQQQQQLQHLQHPPSSRHSEQESAHDVEAGYHKQSQAPHQVRSGHNEQAAAPATHGYYEHEGHGASHGSGRPTVYGSQPLHPSAAQERQGAPYPPYRTAGTSHDQPYRSYPGGSARQPPGNDLASKDDHVRGGPGGRGSMGHLPPEHSSLPHSSQRQQHSQHMPQHSQQLQQQQQQQHDYRHGSASFHQQQQQQQQQYPPQQKLMHVQDHPHSQYPPPHHQHNAPTKISSPRHGQPLGGHPGEQHDPNYRHQIPHAQGHGHGHGGPPW